MSDQNKSTLSINSWFLMAVFGLMAVGSIVAIIFFFRTGSVANEKIAASTEAKRPANVELVTITDTACTDCFNINQVLDYIKKENINITTEKIVDKNSDEGKQLIQQFAIKKLPALTIKGELAKLTNLAPFFQQTGDTSNDTFVFRQVGAPYTSVETGTVKGRINFTLITDASCTTCYDVTQHEVILKNNFGIDVTANVIDVQSAAGKALIQKYKISLVPTFVLSGEPAEYPSLTEAWADVGTVSTDGAYIFTGVPLMGTYRDLASNKTITPTTTPQ